jgi:hypothetical protein
VQRRQAVRDGRLQLPHLEARRVRRRSLHRLDERRSELRRLRPLVHPERRSVRRRRVRLPRGEAYLLSDG